MERGPSPVERYSYTSVLNFMKRCTRYVANLQSFQQYCLWRYTIGSASINSYLIFKDLSDNSVYWTYLFFLYYYNTYGTADNIPKNFAKWTNYFRKPSSFLTQPDAVKLKVAGEVIPRYINVLQNIILRAPLVTKEFHVFKVASKYPALPENNSEISSKGNVLQLPINSTTINPLFNFAPFLPRDANCCFFDITVPRGSKCLYIPSEFHAYPFEKEILLPHDCIFKITKIQPERLNYIDSESVNVSMLQDKQKIQLGPVYEINEYVPCKSYQCMIKVKIVNVYYATYQNP